MAEVNLLDESARVENAALEGFAGLNNHRQT
jgi:hypothetical protein